ncbi:MAG: hypothetical protein JWL97_4328 [Gemmatimonadales bacterium]|nr:hypothetical protein [Gemmatimonadales bacterium]
MEFLLVIWLFCAVACAVIASAKGKSAGAWLFWGFLFGVFALIAVAFSTRGPNSAASAGTPLVLDKATGLLVVGTPQPVPPRVLGGAAPPSPEFKTCPYCAEEVRFQAVKCKHCQSELPAQVAA